MKPHHDLGWTVEYIASHDPEPCWAESVHAPGLGTFAACLRKAQFLRSKQLGYFYRVRNTLTQAVVVIP